MKIVRLEKGLGECTVRASGVLRQGGVIIYPTDTLYGLGADAFSDEAVAKVYAIKGRSEQKPIHCVVADLAMAEEYADVNDAVRRLAEEFLPGPLTLVMRKKSRIDSGIARGMDTIGVRIPNDEFCIELAKSFGKPYTATSANKSEEVPHLSIEKIVGQLGDSIRLVDLVIDAGLLPLRASSTVVNVVSGLPVILREGAISSRDILAIVDSVDAPPKT